MRTLSWGVLTLISLTTVATLALAGQVERPWFIYGRKPDSSVSQWIRFVVLGNRNSPFPIIWISPQHFRTSGFPEFLIELRRPRYKIVDNFTKIRIMRSDCVRRDPRRPPWYTVEISQYADGYTRMCIIPGKSACRYLSGILRLPGVDWTSDERKPIANFMHGIKCDSN